jgi:hypothetical protein
MCIYMYFLNVIRKLEEAHFPLCPGLYPISKEALEIRDM